MINAVTTITVHVKPGSRKGPLVVAESSGELTVFLRERAVEGKANEGLVKALAAHFGVPKSRVEIVRGHASRTKHVQIDA
jgi:uncharacterized protein (TIGR00251 family)